MTSAAENMLHSPQGDETVKDRVPIPVINVKSAELSGISGL